MIVHFTVDGAQCTMRVDTKNANFARDAAERAHSGARVWLILAGPR